jgi:hypothetical protein
VSETKILREALRAVADMHAEKFTPGRATNRDRLVQVCVAHLGALLDEHEAMRARCDALTIENGRLERGARAAVELAVSRMSHETYAKQVAEIDRLRKALDSATRMADSFVDCAESDGEHEDETAEYRASIDGWRESGGLDALRSAAARLRGEGSK